MAKKFYVTVTGERPEVLVFRPCFGGLNGEVWVEEDNMNTKPPTESRWELELEFPDKIRKDRKRLKSAVKECLEQIINQYSPACALPKRSLQTA